MKPFILMFKERVSFKKKSSAFKKSSQNSYKYIQFYLIFFKNQKSKISNSLKKCTEPYTLIVA